MNTISNIIFVYINSTDDEADDLETDKNDDEDYTKEQTNNGDIFEDLLNTAFKNERLDFKALTAEEQETFD